MHHEQTCEHPILSLHEALGLERGLTFSVYQLFKTSTSMNIGMLQHSRASHKDICDEILQTSPWEAKYTVIIWKYQNLKLIFGSLAGL